MNLLENEIIKGRYLLKRKFIMNKVLGAVWYSSVDEKKISLTIKSLTVFIPAVVILLNSFGNGSVESVDLQQVFDSTSGVVTAGFVFVSACTGLYGAIRKIVLNVRG